jgi:general secretion pathway protein J
LLKNVEGLTILYYGSPPGGGVDGWQPRWAARGRLPSLIWIRLQFPPGDGRIWPELIVHPSATVDTQCVLDIKIGKCRGRV